ncbi:MAG: VWA domain-containing protein [Acidobacteriota bacterium]
MRGLRRFVVAIVVTLAAVTPGAQDATFRAGVDAVSVGVSVQRGGRPVSGLAVTDFQLLDNGVVQQIASLSYEKVPIDLTVLLDISGSVSGKVLEQLRQSAGDLQKTLRPSDRLRILTFNMRVRRLIEVDAEQAVLAPAFTALAPGGSSAVLDTLAVALASGTTADRRQFIVLLSDGKDSISITTPEALLETARRTSPTVSVVLATPIRRPADRIYTELAAETGGTTVALLPSETLGSQLRRTVETFRSSYVLTFTPTGVTREGSHALEVRVQRPAVEVRARRSYVVR